jgi:hypothetical protein
MMTSGLALLRRCAALTHTHSHTHTLTHTPLTHTRVHV